MGEKSRKIPDIFQGLFVSDIILGRSERVEKNKSAFVEKKKRTTIQNQKEKQEKREKRNIVFDQFVDEYGGKSLGAVNHAGRKAEKEAS